MAKELRDGVLSEKMMENRKAYFILKMFVHCCEMFLEPSPALLLLLEWVEMILLHFMLLSCCVQKKRDENENNFCFFINCLIH